MPINKNGNYNNLQAQLIYYKNKTYFVDVLFIFKANQNFVNSRLGSNIKISVEA